MKHGDPEKTKATSYVLEGVDVFVGRRFGFDLPRLVKKIVCVIVRTSTLKNAIRIITLIDLGWVQKLKRN